MLRISRIEGQHATWTFRLEGQLREPWIGEMTTLIEQANVPTTSIRLDLAGLTYLDQPGVSLLHDLIRRGTQVVACSGFVSEMLNIKL